MKSSVAQVRFDDDLETIKFGNGYEYSVEIKRLQGVNIPARQHSPFVMSEFGIESKIMWKFNSDLWWKLSRIVVIEIGVIKVEWPRSVFLSHIKR